MKLLATIALSVAFGLLSACGGSSGGNDGGDTAGDEARRAVLADIGSDIILPSLREFAGLANTLKIALDGLAAAPDDPAARADARSAWRAAMNGWQRNEPLQVGPAGRSSGLDATPGGADLRDQIYSFPVPAQQCIIDTAAFNDEPVDEDTRIDAKGLAALEYLLFFEGENSACPPGSGVDFAAKRAEHAARIGNFLAQVADDLRTRWEPNSGNFLAQWSTAGAGSTVYSRPQDALDALSVALFYTEKDTKDDKIADPTGIGASGLTPCPDTSCPERLESRLSRHSGENIRENVEAFRDVFTGVNSGMGINDLLRGIGRDDIADKLVLQLADTLTQLSNVTPDFDTAVEQIPDRDQCVNASSNPSFSGSNLSPCHLHGFIKRAMDTFRAEVVAALSLATPDRAAGDND